MHLHSYHPCQESCSGAANLASCGMELAKDKAVSAVVVLDHTEPILVLILLQHEQPSSYNRIY